MSRPGALAVAAGILASRLAGLLRAAATSAAFGVGAFADVFHLALRAPNILQNLLGEQALSAAFIPVYSRMRARGDDVAARHFAGAAFGLLLAVAGGLALLGVVAARPVVALFGAGFLGDAAAVEAGELAVDRYELAVRAVRWIFPMVGVLVLSAWALAILNSHRRFFLPYAAPALWNGAIVAALAWSLASHGEGAGERMLLAACVGALAGGLLQFLVQLPGTLHALGGFRPSLSLGAPGVREALRAFAPAVAGRGVVQISSYLDQILASFLAVGAVGALGYAQMLYLLPVSIFGQSVAAAALPDLARDAATGGANLAARTRSALAATAFFVLPTSAAYLVLAPVLVAGLYRLFPGRFGADDVLLVSAVLVAYGGGLAASTSSRVLQSTYFALGDTRTPARIAASRVGVSASVALPLMLLLDRFAVSDLRPGGGEESALRLGAVGLALAATLGAWVERGLLKRRLHARLEGFAPGFSQTMGRFALALLALLPALASAWLFAEIHPTLRALAAGGALAAAYLVLARILRLPELDQLTLPALRSRRRPTA
jgi:putative peptidoglycan lipid II flippase